MANNLWAYEIYFEIKKQDKHTRVSHCLGESNWYETHFTSVSEAYEGYQQEFGRCIGKLYEDDEEKVQTGWIFEKRAKYDDCNETYLQHTFVELAKKKPAKIVTWNIENAFA